MERALKKLTTILASAAAIGLAVPAIAQEKGDESKKTAKKDDPDVVTTKHGLTIKKPGGWVVKKPTKGTVVVLGAAGDPRSRIEFRVAPGMSDKKAPRYFNTFHTNLQSAGLARVRKPSKATYGKNVGEEAEYEAKSKDKNFRLIVWQSHQVDNAWLIVGFFEAEQRGNYYEDFKSLIESLDFAD